MLELMMQFVFRLLLIHDGEHRRVAREQNEVLEFPVTAVALAHLEEAKATWKSEIPPKSPENEFPQHPDKPWRIDEDKFHSKSRNTPYHGRPVQGRVWRTIVDGKVVYSDPEEE